MALNTEFPNLPYLHQQDQGESRSFMTAYEEARRENSPMYKAELAQQQQQVQQQAALFPLKKQLAEFQIQDQALALEKAQYDKSMEFEGRKAVTKMSGIMAEALRADKLLDPETEAALYGVQAQAPTPLGASFLQNVDLMIGKARDARNRSEIANLRATTDIEKASLKAEVDLTKAAASNELAAAKVQSASELATAKMEAAQNKLSPAAQEAEDLARYKRQERFLQTQLNKPEEEFPGQTKDVQSMLEDVRSKIQTMEARHGLEETEITTPGGPTVRITKGQKKTPETLTTGEQTRLGEDLQSSANALRSLGQLSDQINAGTVGAMPAIKSTLFDEALAQLDPSFADPKRIAARARIGVTTQQILGELNRSGRFSNIELKRIEENMPSKGLLESPENAQTLVRVMRQTLAEKGARAAVAMKRGVPSEIISTLADIDDATLAQDVRDGFLDFEVAQQARQFRKQRGK